MPMTSLHNKATKWTLFFSRNIENSATDVIRAITDKSRARLVLQSFFIQGLKQHGSSSRVTVAMMLEL